MNISKFKNLAQRLWARLRLNRKMNKGWLNDEVRLIMEETRKKRGAVPLKERARGLALPDWKAIKVIVIGFLISIPFSWILCVWDPRVLSLGNTDRILSTYTTIWQVQAGIAAVALPILLFVIGLSKDEKQAPMRFTNYHLCRIQFVDRCQPA